MNAKALVLLSLCPLLLLSGCGQLRKAVGMTRQSPDEFEVVTHAPLELPADMTDLPPPRPGVARPQEVTPSETASAALQLGGAKAGAPSDAEAALLNQANANAADPAIRQTVNTEAAADRRDGETIGQQILFWQKRAEPGTIVDPEAEKARIRNAEQSGKPITDGETPMIEPHVPGTNPQ